jgi:hypothetical protein
MLSWNKEALFEAKIGSDFNYMRIIKSFLTYIPGFFCQVHTSVEFLIQFKMWTIQGLILPSLIQIGTVVSENRIF